MKSVLQFDLILAFLGSARTFIPAPSAPSIHKSLRIGPRALSHLDLLDVGEQSLGAPAQDALLNLHESKEDQKQSSDCDGHNAKEFRPTLALGHISLDTEEAEFVPKMPGKEMRELFEK
ncbi:MAG TPA: hypothetical protein VL986_13555 [Terracidiphilus sp.]|nr:hypothetical protein [Terracidiphilus sp.]